MRIISAAMKAVRQYGLEGVRIQNISKLAGVSPGALYPAAGGVLYLCRQAGGRDF